jgi:methyl-accepting chemotaxis protein
MNSISNLKIGTRIGIGFGLVALQLIVGAALGLWSMTAIHDSMNESIEEGHHLRSALEVEAHYGQFLFHLWNYVSNEDAKEMQEHQEAMTEARTKYRKTIDTIKSGDTEPEAVQLASRLDKAMTDADTVNNQITALVQEGKRAKATELYLDKGDASRKEIEKVVGDIVALQEGHVARGVVNTTTVEANVGKIMYGGTFAGVLVAFVVGVLITRSVTKPLGDSVNLVTRVSEGDVSADVPNDLRERRDELGNVARSLQAMIESLRQVIGNVAKGVETLATSATDLSAASGQTSDSAKGVSEKATTVAGAAEQASANTLSVATSMEAATSNLSSVASATEQMSATVGDIAANSEKARVISEQANSQAQTISTLMQQLGEAAREIGKVTETITDISSQTNLLALNATIEAARAGAAGKGFAVVANEIKELARQTAGATEDIKAKIAGVQTSAGGAIADIEKISGIIKDVGHIVASIAAAIEEQAAVTKDVATNIAQASAGVKDASDRVSQTATVSRSIAQDIAGVNGAMAEIRQGGQTVESSASELARLADQLKMAMAHFKV